MTTPQPGDFGLVNMIGNVGKLISVGEWLNGDGFGHFDHAFVLLGSGLILEAEPGGARIRPMDEYSIEGYTTVWSRWDLTPDQRAAIVAAARKYVGVPYSALDYFALAAHRLHLPLPFLRKRVASSHHLICSQLVDQVYQDAGIALFADGRWPGYVTPASLSRALAGPVT